MSDDRNISIEEKWYDDEIAPELHKLAKRCQAQGMSFVAVVAYEPGERHGTYYMAKDAGLAMLMTSLCAHSAPNVDAFLIGLVKYCHEHGISTDNSIYLSRKWSGGPRGERGVVRMKTGIELIAEERKRQVEAEGWTARHDDERDAGEMAAAGAAYAQNAADQLYPQSQGDGGDSMPNCWPWVARWWKPKGPLRDLVRAGALIAAEIDRLQRRSQAPAANQQHGVDCPKAPHEHFSNGYLHGATEDGQMTEQQEIALRFPCWRRLTEAEASGAPNGPLTMRDVRGTKEALDRVRNILRVVPQAKQLAMMEVFP